MAVAKGKALCFGKWSKAGNNAWREWYKEQFKAYRMVSDTPFFLDHRIRMDTDQGSVHAIALVFKGIGDIVALDFSPQRIL
jgi:hypothetical protein